MSLCIAGCGFYGKPENMGMCSRCYKEQTSGFAPASVAKPVAEGKQSVLKVELRTPKGVAIQVRLGDMTEERVDCIVNAANSSLDHASGLAGAIVKKGGKGIQDESDRWLNKNGRLEEGGIAVTGAGALPCKSVIHAVGPTWHGGAQGEELMLQVAVRNCLTKADCLGYTSISLPAISSGIFGFPKPNCARCMFDIALEYVAAEKTNLKEIRFTNFDSSTVEIFEQECIKRGGVRAGAAPPAAAPPAATPPPPARAQPPPAQAPPAPAPAPAPYLQAEKE